LPEERKKKHWDLFISFLLLYTSIFVPIRVAFIDETSDFLLFWETLIDTFFITDIVLTFFTAFKKQGNQLETRATKIAKHYLKGWFWIDLISSFPFQLVEKEILNGSTNNVKLTRIVRIPRIYRIVRVFRLLKLVKKSRKKGVLRLWLQDFLSITNSNSSLVALAATVLGMTHMVACFFFLQAKWLDFPADSWVALEGHLAADSDFQYDVAFYWALQTLTTVGFGDVTTKSVNERIFAIVWMIVGIAFYSYVIGNISNMIANSDAQNSHLNH